MEKQETTNPMLQIDFHQNQNGKLFLDNFGEIFPKSDTHVIGNDYQAWHKSLFLGTIKIEALRSFYFRQVTDVVSFLNCGRPAHFQAALLKKLYSEQVLFPDSMLDHVVFSYVSRNLEAQSSLMEEWWRERTYTQ